MLIATEGALEVKGLALIFNIYRGTIFGQIWLVEK